MKIYIAAKFERRDFLRGIRDELWKYGHYVTSTWLDETKKPEGMSDQAFKRKLAAKDLCEIYSSDLLILDTTDRGLGRENEFGFALGRFQHQQVWIVGTKSTVFHELADRVFYDWRECLKSLEPEVPPVPVDYEVEVKRMNEAWRTWIAPGPDVKEGAVEEGGTKAPEPVLYCNCINCRRRREDEKVA